MSEQQVDLQSPNSQGNEFRCNQCGAEMTYDAAAQLMRCNHCDNTRPVGVAEGTQNIVEYNLEDGLAKAAERGFGTPVKTTMCKECGATVSFGENVTSTKCDFCDSSQVLEQEANRNVIRPESLVPFQVDESSATGKFSSWIKGLWFRPNDLKHRAKVKDMAGVYVPYWTFDTNVDSDWTAQAGYYYYETEHYIDEEGNAQEKRVQKIRWEPAWGSRSDFHDDVLICASKGLPDNLAKKLRTFNTAQLVTYDPQYLSGWKAEEYAVELNDGWTDAVGQIEAIQHQRCSGDVPGDTQQSLNVANRFRDETFKHVLLPIWISAYRYKDEVYRFLVNGQTGEVTGKAPYSVIKIVLFIMLIVGIIGGLIFLFTR